MRSSSPRSRTPRSSQAGSAAASSHTGSLAGSDAVNNVIFDKLNIYRAHDLDDMFDALSVFSSCGPMKKDGIAIITNAGGLGVMSADAAFEAPNVYAVKFSDKTIEEIKTRVPTVAGLTNPIDVRGDAKPEYFREVIDIVTKDPEVGGLVIMGSPLDTADLESVAKIIVEMKDEIPVPTVVCFAGGVKCDRANAIFKEGKMPTYPTPDRAVHALSVLRGYTKNLDKAATPMEVPDVKGYETAQKVLGKAKAEGRDSLTESEGKEIFAAYGVPTPGEALVNSAEDAAAACDKIGYPVVMKIVSPDIKHKTDVGGVVVGVKDAEEAKAAYTKIMDSCTKNVPGANIVGVSIQQMVSGQEVILSMIRDPQFGPVISFGLGGIYVTRHLLRSRRNLRRDSRRDLPGPRPHDGGAAGQDDQVHQGLQADVRRQGTARGRRRRHEGLHPQDRHHRPGEPRDPRAGDQKE